MTTDVVTPPEGAPQDADTAPAPEGVDASLWRALLEHVAPLLRTYPSVTAWTPACGAGTTAWTVAALLDAAGLLARGRIYASDADDALLAAAKQRGPPAGLSDGADARVVWCEHNLATDASLNEFQLIVCDDGFDGLPPDVALRALALARESLCIRGVLVASPGTVASVEHDGGYERLDPTVPVFRKRA